MQQSPLASWTAVAQPTARRPGASDVAQTSAARGSGPWQSPAGSTALKMAEMHSTWRVRMPPGQSEPQGPTNQAAGAQGAELQGRTSGSDRGAQAASSAATPEEETHSAVRCCWPLPQ